MPSVHSGTHKSRTYKEAAATTFSINREYARFAANAIIAHRAFRIMDKDGSGYIERGDLHAELLQIFNGPGSETKGNKKLNAEDIKASYS